MGYVVKEEDLQIGEVTRRGPFVTEQEARLALANAVEQAMTSSRNWRRPMSGRKSRMPFATVARTVLMTRVISPVATLSIRSDHRLWRPSGAFLPDMGRECRGIGIISINGQQSTVRHGGFRHLR